MGHTTWRAAAEVAAVLAVAMAAGTVSAGTAAAAGTPKLVVVAGESSWGSIAAQLAGTRAKVASIITNPATDPHDYEAKPSDARAVASARYVIVNGIGYDAWLQKLLDVDAGSDRKVLDVGKLVGVADGGNPHQWYSPDVVHAVVDRISADLSKLDRAHADYYARRRAAYLANGLKRYDDLIAAIRQRYAGTPVGASESVVTPLAHALGLKLLTPESFLDAVAEGTDPTAHDKSAVDDEITSRKIKVFVYNRQNATPDVNVLVRAARAAEIPVVSVTETLSPATATFQAWQDRQLTALEAALARSAAS